MKNILYLVIPCYNEEQVLNETIKRLNKKMKQLVKSKIISKDSKVLFVNDGSTDDTWNIILDYYKKNNLFTGICLSRNMGHQNALYAGLMESKKYADIVISMNADLQDDIDLIDKMISEYNKGNEIVYAVRKSRKKDNFFKKNSAQLFYKFMNIMGVDIIYNHADYRLATTKVLDNLEEYQEVNLFLRGIFRLIGYSSSIVYYEREKRYAGKSKYSLKKMLDFAWNGITSFSIKPLKIILNIGIVLFIVSIGMIIYSIIRKITGNTVSGWTFLICSIWLISGIQMLSLGIIGEYVGRTYIESKKRPKYFISKNLMEEE